MPYSLLDKLGKPDFVNEINTKFWEITLINKEINKYNLVLGAYYIETKDGERLFVLSNGQQIIYETTSYEALCCYVDALAVIKNSDEKEKEENAKRKYEKK